MDTGNLQKYIESNSDFLEGYGIEINATGEASSTCTIVGFPDEVEDKYYDNDSLEYYLKDIQNIKREDNSTVRTNNVRQTVIGFQQQGLAPIENKLTSYSFQGRHYTIRVVKDPFLIGVINVVDGNCDDNIGLFPCSGYYAIEIIYTGDCRSLTGTQEEKVIERVLYFLTNKCNTAVYKSSIIQGDDLYYPEEYEDLLDSLTETKIDVDKLPRHSGLYSLYLQARSTIDPEIKFVFYYKMIEYISPLVAKMSALKELKPKIDSLPVDKQFEDYDSILDIASRFKDNLKDEQLSKAVLQACINDVTIIFDGLPKRLELVIEKNLHDNGLPVDKSIKDAALDDSFKKSITQQVATILYSTRNNIVHAKSNYTKTGFEIDVKELDGANQMMDSIANRLIEWNFTQEKEFQI